MSEVPEQSPSSILAARLRHLEAQVEDYRGIIANHHQLLQQFIIHGDGSPTRGGSGGGGHHRDDRRQAECARLLRRQEAAIEGRTLDEMNDSNFSDTAREVKSHRHNRQGRRAGTKRPSTRKVIVKTVVVRDNQPSNKTQHGKNTHKISRDSRKDSDSSHLVTLPRAAIREALEATAAESMQRRIVSLLEAMRGALPPLVERTATALTALVETDPQQSDQDDDFSAESASPVVSDRRLSPEEDEEMQSTVDKLSRIAAQDTAGRIQNAVLRLLNIWFENLSGKVIAAVNGPDHFFALFEKDPNEDTLAAFMDSYLASQREIRMMMEMVDTSSSSVSPHRHRRSQQHAEGSGGGAEEEDAGIGPRGNPFMVSTRAVDLFAEAIDDAIVSVATAAEEYRNDHLLSRSTQKQHTRIKKKKSKPTAVIRPEPCFEVLEALIEEVFSEATAEPQKQQTDQKGRRGQQNLRQIPTDVAGEAWAVLEAEAKALQEQDLGDDRDDDNGDDDSELRDSDDGMDLDVSGRMEIIRETVEEFEEAVDGGSSGDDDAFSSSSDEVLPPAQHGRGSGGSGVSPPRTPRGMRLREEYERQQRHQHGHGEHHQHQRAEATHATISGTTGNRGAATASTNEWGSLPSDGHESSRSIHHHQHHQMQPPPSAAAASTTIVSTAAAAVVDDGKGRLAYMALRRQKQHGVAGKVGTADEPQQQQQPQQTQYRQSDFTNQRDMTTRAVPSSTAAAATAAAAHSALLRYQEPTHRVLPTSTATGAAAATSGGGLRPTSARPPVVESPPNAAVREHSFHREGERKGPTRAGDGGVDRGSSDHHPSQRKIERESQVTSDGAGAGTTRRAGTTSGLGTPRRSNDSSQLKQTLYGTTGAEDHHVMNDGARFAQGAEQGRRTFTPPPHHQQEEQHELRHHHHHDTASSRNLHNHIGGTGNHAVRASSSSRMNNNAGVTTIASARLVGLQHQLATLEAQLNAVQNGNQQPRELDASGSAQAKAWAITRRMNNVKADLLREQREVDAVVAMTQERSALQSQLEHKRHVFRR